MIQNWFFKSCIICEEKFPDGHLQNGFCFYCIKKLEKIKKKHNV